MKLIQHFWKVAYQEEEIEMFGVFKDDEAFERFRKGQHHEVRKGAEKELNEKQFEAFKKVMEAK